jgi:hypothetical protein
MTCTISRRGTARIRPLGLYTISIVCIAALLGLIVAPRRVVRAWRASGAGRRSLFHDSQRRYDQLVALSTGAFRESLSIPAEGLARGRRGLHSTAPER